MLLHPDGSLIYSSTFDNKLYRFRDGHIRSSPICRHHDLVAYMDRAGRVYLEDTGARVLHGEDPKPGRLVMVDTDGPSMIVAESLVFPNALLITNDGRSLFVAETFGLGVGCQSLMSAQTESCQTGKSSGLLRLCQGSPKRKPLARCSRLIALDSEDSI